VVSRRRAAALAASPVDAGPGDPELDELRFLALLAGDDLPAEAQVLLVLRFGCGLSTEALAAMHHVPRATMAARLTRAKQRLRAATAVRGDAEAPIEPQLPVIIRAVYLIFTAGRNPATGEAGEDTDRLLHADFLSAVLHRRWPSADTAALRIMVALAADPPAVEAAQRLAGCLDTVTPFTVQAMIMLEHTVDPPRWLRIAELYDALLRAEPNATFAVGRAVACSYAFGPEVGLADLDDLATRPDLSGYRYLHAARADCLTRLGRHAEAAEAYGVAADLASNAAQRAYFAARVPR
jgi:RNA polymerase sigma-70 factor (ECF subfamily)